MTKSTYNFNAAMVRQPILIGLGLAAIYFLYQEDLWNCLLILIITVFSHTFEYERFHVDRYFTSAAAWLSSFKEHLTKKVEWVNKLLGR